jgi:hypothetical protein
MNTSRRPKIVAILCALGISALGTSALSLIVPFFASAQSTQIAINVSVVPLFAPASVTGYTVTVTCPSGQATAIYPAAGESFPIYFNVNASTTCTFRVGANGTLGATSPQATIKLNGDTLAVQTNGETSLGLPVTGPSTAEITVAFPITTDDYGPVRPTRLLDTRYGIGGINRIVTADEVIPVNLPPGKASAINITVTEPQAAGWIVAYPCGDTAPSTSNVNFAAAQTVANMAVVAPGTNNQTCIKSSAATHLIVDLNGVYPSNSSYAPRKAQRIADTRIGPGGSGMTSKLTAGQTVQVTLVPAKAGVINVTVYQPEAAGWLVVYPCGTTPPATSNLNFAIGQTAANLVFAEPGTSNQACIRTSAATHLIVDISGTLPTSSTYVPSVSTRRIDSRIALGAATKLNAGHVASLDVAGRKAVTINVTVTDPVGSGYITVYPCGTTRPIASNLNFAAGQTMANLVLAHPGVGGLTCIYTSVATHLIVDIEGSHPIPTYPAA